MSLFSSILEKLGIGQPAEPSAQATTSAPTAASMPPSNSPSAPPAAVVETSPVDVVAKLEELAASNPQTLNWKVSIVDLLKLLGLDSSLETRKELAAELDCPQDKMGDSAHMNMWLHKTVLQKLADNGGNIPQKLL
jgi:hypothetical protein